MPFKSKKQQHKFAAMVKEGKISQETFNEWARSTDYDSLPERVTTPKKAYVKVIKPLKPMGKK